jgi:glutamate 5-kinase
VGLSSYSSQELEEVKGLRSDQIAGAAHSREAAEVIHRDNLVVFGLEEEESVACLLNN